MFIAVVRESLFSPVTLLSGFHVCLLVFLLAGVQKSQRVFHVFSPVPSPKKNKTWTFFSVYFSCAHLKCIR